MPIIVYSDVFEFCGTPSDVQTTQQTAITNLIARVESEIEQMLGRKITDTTVTNVLFQDGLNCEIIGDQLFLKGIYRDLYSVTTITENGVTLSAVTDYGSSNDYYLDSVKGFLIRANNPWSLEPFAIKITGKVCLGGSATSLATIKQAAVEMTAAKSGLWKFNIETEGGTIQQVRTSIHSETKKSLEKFILRDV